VILSVVRCPWLAFGSYWPDGLEIGVEALKRRFHLFSFLIRLSPWLGCGRNRARAAHNGPRTTATDKSLLNLLFKNLPIKSTPLNQFIVPASLHNSPVLQNQNLIRMLHSGKAMGDDERGAAFA
jgi:hypothetical protein